MPDTVHADQKMRELQSKINEMKAAIARVLEIHSPEQYHDELHPWCTYCNRDDNQRDDVVLWPCPTLVALDTPVTTAD
jgi:hypothetical protein